MGTISPEHAAALEASKKAETVIMRYFGRDVQMRQKSDLTPVTQADIEAEQVIIASIRRHFPKHGFLGEETGESHINSEFVWVIDPIDGTKNFIRGIPLFSTQIALLKDGIPVLGVSRLPAMQELIHGEVGYGSYMNGRRIQVSSVDDVSSAFISLGGLNHFIATGQIKNILKVAQSAGRVRSLGDAYAYHLLATGRCEAVMEARIRIWDVAALSVIVAEAGGVCTDLQGRKIGLDTTSVICSNGKLHSQLLDLFGATY